MFAKEKKLIDTALKKHLPKDNSILSRAMRYSVFAGGKRFRSILMLLTTEMLKGKTKDVLPAAAAIEMIHTFTLIHDDLPCMDNSSLRRGKPTSHKKFGEEIALLAGDALNSLAFNIVAENPKVVIELSSAVNKVIYGQVLDLAAEKKKVSLNELIKIHKNKTAALIVASVRSAAILSRANKKQINLLSQFACEMGLAFQIADDILDFVSTPEVVGKPTRADQVNKKSTYPILLGIEKAKKMAFLHHSRAISLLNKTGKDCSQLILITDYAIRRLK